MTPDNVTCVMISCAQRSDARAKTIPQLQRAGLTVHAFLSPCNPASQISNGEVSGRALAWAVTRDKPVLFVEDDIDLGADFEWYLQRADPTITTWFYLNEQKVGRATSLYGRDVAATALTQQPMRRQFVTARHYLGLFGTQCVLVPRAVARALAIELQAPRMAFDGHLPQYLERHQLPARIAVPNPVQHRNVRVARDLHGPAKYSLSFDCPRLADHDDH